MNEYGKYLMAIAEEIYHRDYLISLSIIMSVYNVKNMLANL